MTPSLLPSPSPSLPGGLVTYSTCRLLSRLFGEKAVQNRPSAYSEARLPRYAVLPQQCSTALPTCCFSLMTGRVSVPRYQCNARSEVCICAYTVPWQPAHRPGISQPGGPGCGERNREQLYLYLSITVAAVLKQIFYLHTRGTLMPSSYLGGNREELRSCRHTRKRPPWQPGSPKVLRNIVLVILHLIIH